LDSEVFSKVQQTWMGYSSARGWDGLVCNICSRNKNEQKRLSKMWIEDKIWKISAWIWPSC